MDFHIDPDSSLPIYAQLIESVKHMVATGRVRTGDQLPTVRQLAVDLRVSLNTIARAYMELARNGIISTQQGRGTYITGPPSASSMSRLRHDRLHALMGRVVLEALSLGYQPNELQETVQAELETWQERRLTGNQVSA